MRNQTIPLFSTIRCIGPEMDTRDRCTSNVRWHMLRGMILGVMSDTHGNLRLMQDTAQAMRERFNTEAIFHLGDDYRDPEGLIKAGFTIYRVPGLWCPEYQDPHISKRFVDTFDGVSIACAHADKDLRYTERAAAIVLTGHTHAARIELLGESLYINPGHLKEPVCRNERASYAVIEISSDSVRAVIREIVTHKIRSEMRVPRHSLA